MKLGIMQPYFFPYIGYFQLMNAVDEFVIYDNIEYTKKGWINRNRILVNGVPAYISLPLKNDSDFLQVKDRSLADTWANDRRKMLNRISESYRKAPFFADVYKTVEAIILYDEKNLFGFILNSIRQINTFLGIKTPVSISSEIEIDHHLKSEEKVIAICKVTKAKQYINPIGGLELYSKEKFSREGIELNFIKSNLEPYDQFGNSFVPALSIIDVMMFNPKEKITNWLTSGYSLT